MRRSFTILEAVADGGLSPVLCVHCVMAIAKPAMFTRVHFLGPMRVHVQRLAAL